MKHAGCRPRALLINPWVYDFKAFDFWNKPLGLLIVARLLRKSGFDITLIDCMDRSSPYYSTGTKTDRFGRGKYHFEVVDKPALYRKVPRLYKRYGLPLCIFTDTIERIERPDIIFVSSTMTYWYPGAFEAIRTLREKFKGAKIILGGIYATLCEAHALKYSGADIVVTGMAEANLPNLLRKLGYSQNNDNNALGIIPDFSLYDKLNYGVVLTSRGCPFKCTYCATRVLCPVFAVTPNTEILEQLSRFAGKTNDIAFFDDALLYNKSFPELLKKIIEKKYDLNLHASNGLHCRYITQDIAGLMSKANFQTIYLSLETTNPAVQQQTGGKVNTEEFMNSVRILTRAGFAPAQIQTYVLYGMPDQGHEEVIDSIKLCHDLGVNPHLCEFSPIPYTAEYEKTGFDENTDPLYHNNLFYTWYYPKPRIALYKKIKRLLTKNKT
ncbi:MAG: radical SAM protein [candidate division WOR-3 bacterium]|nr:radical SAM protein [candidate division WOR-3 bacterium]